MIFTIGIWGAPIVNICENGWPEDPLDLGTSFSAVTSCFQWSQFPQKSGFVPKMMHLQPKWKGPFSGEVPKLDSTRPGHADVTRTSRGPVNKPAPALAPRGSFARAPSPGKDWPPGTRWKSSGDWWRYWRYFLSWSWIFCPAVRTFLLFQAIPRYLTFDYSSYWAVSVDGQSWYAYILMPAHIVKYG
jgi:hypothetical protein